MTTENNTKYFYVTGIYNYTNALSYYAKNIKYTSCIVRCEDGKYPTMDYLIKKLFERIEQEGERYDCVFELGIMCCNEWSLEQVNAFNSVKPKKEKRSSID